MYESLKDLKSKMDAAKAELAEKGKDAVKVAFKEFFDAHPEVLALRWKQYTPYFNDGEPCEFSVGSWSIKTHTTEGSEDEYGEEGFAGEYDRAIVSEAMRKEVQELFNLAGDETMEIAFGDHADVTATRNGFDVEEYEHD